MNCNTAPLALAEWHRGLTFVAAASAVHLLLHLDLHQIGVVLGQQLMSDLQQGQRASKYFAVEASPQ